MRAVLIVGLSALLWGLWWIPLRWLESLGLEGAWSNVLMNAGGAFFLLLIWLCRPKQGLKRATAIGAILTGIAISLYGTALLNTEVSRAVLLFYLAPAWGLGIEISMGLRRWRSLLLIPLALAFTALVVALGSELSLKGLNLGDFIAIASGLIWALGATFLFQDKQPALLPITTLNFVAATVCAGGLAYVIGSLPSQTLAWHLSLIAMGLGAVFLVGIVVIALWGASRLSPMTLSLVLTLELVSGLGSAALLLDEPFGLSKTLAIGLILLAIATQTWIDGHDSSPKSQPT